METTVRKCKKGPSVLKALAAMGFEQRHLFLLHLSVVLSATDYRLGLTSMTQTYLPKLDKVQNEATRVIPRRTQPLRPRDTIARHSTNANQTENGAGQSILQCRQKSPQPTPWSRERYKWMQTGTGQVLDWSSRGLCTASMPADRTQAVAPGVYVRLFQA